MKCQPGFPCVTCNPLPTVPTVEQLELCDVCSGLTSAPSAREALQNGCSPDLFFFCAEHATEAYRTDTVVLPPSELWEDSALA